MNQVINEKLINRNKKIGNITSILGIAILIAGLILNFQPTTVNTILSFSALIVGFVVAQISTSYVNRFGRSPRMDEVFGENLSKLNNDYTYYVYSSPIPMLLVGSSGLWIPIPVSASGEIYFDKKWKQRGGSFLFKFFGQENIGKPTIEAVNNEKVIREFISQHLDESEMPPINTVLVSMNPKAMIGDVENAPLPIVKPDGLRRHIRRVDRKAETEISPEILAKINAALAQGKG
jgi:hypothetical protein